MAKNKPYSRLQGLLQSLGYDESFEMPSVKPTLCAPYGDDLSPFGFKKVSWAPYIWQGDVPLPKGHNLLSEHKVFAIGLASALTCLQLQLKPGAKVLDMCAAPGIKSLYLQILHDRKLDMYVNDVSNERLIRLRSLFDQFKMPLPTFSNQPGQTLHMRYKPHYFDAVIIDAPCSGEGNALTGDVSALENWSMAKVKRLAQLQRKLLKTGFSLLKQGGDFIYATCTLNPYENEKVLAKAGAPVETIAEESLDFSTIPLNQAKRLIPSTNSIGFFVSRISPPQNKQNFD